MAAICIEVACSTDDELEEEIMLKVEEFNRMRQDKENALPLTDYEKMLLVRFLRSLIG